MKLKHIAVVGVAATGLALGLAPAPAGAADYAPPTAKIWPVVWTSAQDPGTAVVTAAYRCFGGDEGTHLFVAVKQGPLVDTGEHSTSEFSDTFFSTNYASDQGNNALHCDGVQHRVSYVLHDDPYWAHSGSAPAFKPGKVLVQFCLFDSSGNEETGAVFDYEMKRLVVLPHHNRFV